MGEEEPAYTFELGSSLAAVWMLVSLVLFVAAAAGVGLLYRLLGQSPFANAGSLVLWPVAFLAVLPVHELIHAAFVRLFGGRPRFGAGFTGGMPYLYVTDPGRRFSRNRFLAIALAPLVLIDLAALALLVHDPSRSWTAPAIVANTSGAVGDLWVAAVLVRFPSWAQVEDRKLGFAVWAPAGRSVDQIKARAPRHRVALPSWISGWLLSTLAIFAVLPTAVLTLLRRSAGATGSSTLWLGPLLVASVRGQPGGRFGARTVAGEINFGLLFVLSAFIAAALVLSWVLWRRRGSR